MSYLSKIWDTENRSTLSNDEILGFLVQREYNIGVVTEKSVPGRATLTEYLLVAEEGVGESGIVVGMADDGKVGETVVELAAIIWIRKIIYALIFFHWSWSNCPGAYIFQRPFLRGLFLKGLIYGGKFAF